MPAGVGRAQTHATKTIAQPVSTIGRFTAERLIKAQKEVFEEFVSRGKKGSELPFAAL